MLIHFEDRLRAVVIFVWDSRARDSDYASGECASREERGRKPEKGKKRLQSAFIHKSRINRDTVSAFILEHSLRRYKKLEYQELKDPYKYFSNTNYIMENS